MRSPGPQAGAKYVAASRVSRTGSPPPSARALYRCPSVPSHVEYAIHSPSGDQVAKCSDMSTSVRRSGFEPSAPDTQSRSSAVKASRSPEGEGAASRIWRTVKVGVSSIG